MAYTKEQEARLTEMGNVTFEDTQSLAEEFGVTPASVRAKVFSLAAQGADITYTPKPKAPKRPRGQTKAEILEDIRDELPGAGAALDGLVKAPAQALEALRVALADVLEAS
jgi:hypothetical protein